MADQERLNQGEFILWTGLGITSFVGFWYIFVLLGVVPKQFLPPPHEVVVRFVHLLQEPFSGYTFCTMVINRVACFVR